MHERFSDRARHAMALANLEAGRLNHDYLAPAHLMLGLIAEGRCVAAETMRLLDVDIDKVRDEVRNRLGTGTAENVIGRRAHTKATKQVIESAIAEARNFGHRYVGTEHLLIALFNQTDSIPAAVLREQSLDVRRIRDKALAALQGDAETQSDLRHSRHGQLEWIHQQELAKAFRSSAFWHTMILAVDSANRAGAAEVEPEHVLLALLRDENLPVARALAEKGVTANWLRSQRADLDQ